MTDSSTEAATTLNQLIQICNDAEYGYRSAAGLMDDLNLRHLFETYAQQRAEFAAELQLEVERLATDPVDGGRATAALQRTRDEVKAGLAGTNEGAILSDCESRENLGVERYQEALNTGLLSEDLKTIVARQYLQVKEAHDHMCSLEKAHSRNS